MMMVKTTTVLLILGAVGMVERGTVLRPCPTSKKLLNMKVAVMPFANGGL